MVEMLLERIIQTLLRKTQHLANNAAPHSIMIYF